MNGWMFVKQNQSGMILLKIRLSGKIARRVRKVEKRKQNRNLSVLINDHSGLSFLTSLLPQALHLKVRIATGNNKQYMSYIWRQT